MSIRLVLCSLLLTLSSAPSHAQGMPTGVVGWYNGDWRQAVPGMNNWQAADDHFARTYDDFVAPEGGWTITGVFAHISAKTPDITRAYWEVRVGMSADSAGSVVVSGLSNAKLTHTETVGGGSEVYLLQVDGLWTFLPAGHYWLAVTPLTEDSHTYLCASMGTNATASLNGQAYLVTVSGTGGHISTAHSTGNGGSTGDYSLGVLVTASPAARDDAWRRNLTSLKQQMFANHGLPFPGVSMEEFTRNADDLSARVADLSDADVRTGMQALVASIGVPHTDVIWPSPRPYRTLPFSLYWFDDGVYVTAAPENLSGFLGAKITGLGIASIDEAATKLTPLTPHDNDSWLKFVMAANKFTNADFLYGTRVTENLAAVRVEARNAAGDLVAADIDTLEPGAAVRTIPVYQGDLPLYRVHADQHYWATVIDDGATVYFQYNSCTEDPKQPSAEFFADLDRLLSQPAVRRLVLDMRNNSGGTTSILNPWIERIRATRFNQPDRLYVIVGRATYSAAMEAADRLRENTAATFVGEPTGGKPRFGLRRGDFGLPYFGIRVSYSRGAEGAADPGPALIPDTVTPVTFENYSKGVDPALDAVLKNPAPDWN